MNHKKIADMVIFAMLGTIMFVSKLITEFLPNIHPIALFITVFTLVYRSKALIPIYVYVFLMGLYAGFNLWWIPYLYIWTLLWLGIMLLPKNISKRKTVIFSAIICGLHGLLYGTLYAPAQAIMFGLTFKGTIAWIIAGLPWDVIHMCGNIVMSLLIFPLYNVISKMENKRTN